MKPKKLRCGRPVRRYRSAQDAPCGRPADHSGPCMSAAALQRKEARRGEVSHSHGYAGYTQGCRCETCTDAKAAYMRQRRASAYTTDSAPEADPAVTHGTRFAYEERGCRCAQCIAAERGGSRRKRARAA